MRYTEQDYHRKRRRRREVSVKGAVAEIEMVFRRRRRRRRSLVTLASLVTVTPYSFSLWSSVVSEFSGQRFSLQCSSEMVGPVIRISLRTPSVHVRYFAL